MPSSRDAAGLTDIATACRHIAEFIAGMDMHEVWKIAEGDIPALLTSIEPLLPTGEDQA